MKKRMILAAAVIAVITLLICSTAALADFGGFSGDSDYGGSDWGGSDSDWGSSWSDSDYSWGIWGSTDSGDGTRSEGCTTGDMMVFLIIIIALVVIIWIAKAKNSQQTPVNTGVMPTSDLDLNDIEDYVEKIDPLFSVSAMQNKLSNLYVRLQDQWCAKDLEPLRPYLTDELYAQSERQLNEIARAGQTPHVERISVLGVNIRGWLQRDGMDHIIAELSTRITTYTTDDETGEIIRGNPNLEKFMTYEWDVCRTTGIMTNTTEETKVINCPNCGAPVNINSTARCPYCSSIITVNDHDWLLYSIKGLSQRTQ